MSESDGLQKLTAYLNQTRRQAETAVDALNVEISRLQQENEAYEAICKELEEEKEQYRNQVEQLKQEGTTKHRLQERDDWRSLIDSVQKDRSRLQEECNTLETALEMAREEITTLQEELEKHSSEQKDAGVFHDGAESFSRTSSPGMRSQRGSMTIVGANSDDMNGSALLSPILDRNGNELNINFTETPRNIVGQLKLELKKAYSQLTTERQQAEAAQLELRLEISRLREELDSVRPRANHAMEYGTGALNGHAGNGVITTRNNSRALVVPNRPIDWLNPLGYIGYWFAGSSSSATDKTKAKKIVIKV